MKTIVEIQQVKKNFNQTIALNEISIKISKNEFVAILGKSGSGKTTLLNILDGLILPNEGKIFIDGKNIYEMKRKKLVLFRRLNIGYVFQDFKLISEFSVIDNILFPVDLDREKIDDLYLELLLNKLNIKHLKNRLVKTLSGGEMQRVSIARAMINKPELILADEPTGNLDSINTELVMKLFVELKKTFSLTLIIATHDYAVAKYADRLIVLKDGMVQKDVQNE